MATQPLNHIVRQLRRAAAPPDDVTDGHLLESFVTRRDEAAFEALVRRHGPMVLGVCRRVLRHEADAEDAFQVTFLVLARKAASVKPRALVGNWLYGVAHNTARRVREMNGKRRAKERSAARTEQSQDSEQTYHQLQGLLDEALSRLPDKYRTPIVLCELEGKPIKEAARQLGWPQGTLATRLSRGRRLLARRLARHGLPLSAGVLALAEGGASAAVPPALTNLTVKAATGLAAGRAAAGLVTSRVAALTEGVLRTMLMTKLKSAVAVVLAVVLAGGAGLLGYQTLMAGPGDTAPAAQAPKPADKEDKSKSDKEALQGTWVAKSGEAKGQELTPEALKNWENLVFEDDKVTRDGRERREGKFALDPDKKPKEIDLFTDANTLKGIYELKGTTLKLALTFGNDRPTEFNSQGGVLLVFEKKK
jgi:RNA polymerase sigma-70 factor (ECF subfamily)